jgi:hypothetical protein
VEITGPSGSAVIQFVLDTGATTTMVNTAILVPLGFDPAVAPQLV